MTSLPLLDRQPVFTPASRTRSGLVTIAAPQPLIPDRVPEAGEQYGFHFDMTKCIGCKCCVVACNEQNGNPAAINWRRVGEIEGGHYPYTQRHYLSMGCNHCLEPSCMTGCPTEAYTKNIVTGVVEHSVDACIGCQYCTWNCSYGVPQYNAARGVVGKCDLCQNRLSDGMAPACVDACPEGAIAVEIVNLAQWRADYLPANAPGLPSAGDSISTTRITLPANMPPDMGRVDTQRLVPEPPHTPLVIMLVLTQLAMGALSVLWLLDLFGHVARLGVAALAALALAGISLGASTLHLGRPVYAWRAMRGLRHSWLSREVLGLSLFALVATVFAATLLLNAPGRAWVGFATLLFGAAGVACSARIYVVRARPAWDSGYTPAEFFATALLLGPMFVRAMAVSDAPWIAWAAAGGGAVQLIAQAMKFLWLARSESFELRASSLLLSRNLRQIFLTRLGLLVAAGIVAPLLCVRPIPLIAAFVLALAGELIGRWLFFVSVAPKNIAAPFTGRTAAAA